MEREDTGRFAALQSRDFALYWLGRVPSAVGTQMHRIAVNWHIFELLRGESLSFSVLGRAFSMDGQALGLGSLGLVRIVPVLLFALIGGISADRFDRRKILLVAEIIAALASALLAWLTFTESVTLGGLYLLTAVEFATIAFSSPAQQSLVPHLVRKEHLSNAVSLTSTMFYLGTIAGPGIAGWLIAKTDLSVVYAINALSFGSVIVSLLLMRYRAEKREAVKFEWEALREGIQFTVSNKLIWSSMLIDFWATFFGSARSMLPLIAERVLGMGVQGYGLLSTAQPVGAVLAGFVLAFRKEMRKQGVVLLVSVCIYGIATAFFGISTVFWVSYFLFALTGAGDMVSSVIRGTIRQLNTPDGLRGRMTSVNMMFFMGGPQLGEIEAGLVAGLFGVPAAIVSGGILTVAMTVWMARRFPELVAYDRYGVSEDTEK